MKGLYIDTSNSGISGDMFLASLLGLIPNPDNVIKDLEELRDILPGVSRLTIELSKIERSGIYIHKLNIEIKESKHHRTTKVLKEALNQYLERKKYTEAAKEYSNKVLDSLIQAEVQVHETLSENIHLHELSSVDTLIDILGVTKALEIIGVFEKDFTIACSKMPLGGGTVKAAHGILPVPAPATVKILEKSNLTTYNGPIDSELVTPTGAALLANLHPKVGNLELKLEKSSYGTGQKKFKNFLNVLRLFHGDLHEEMKSISEAHGIIEPVTLLETDVDDVSGEIIGNFIDSLKGEEILDIHVIPSITKKNRPGHVIRVLCKPEVKFKVIDKIIFELGTLGVRFEDKNRVCVNREIETHEVKILNQTHQIRYKISFIEQEQGEKIVNVKPEFDDLKEISRKTGLSVKEVQFFANSIILEIIKKKN